MPIRWLHQGADWQLQDVVEYTRAYAQEYGFEPDHFQSNHEGLIVDKIQEADGVCAGIIINPGPFTQYSHAIRVCTECPPGVRCFRDFNHGFDAQK